MGATREALGDRLAASRVGPRSLLYEAGEVIRAVAHESPSNLPIDRAATS